MRQDPAFERLLSENRTLRRKLAESEAGHLIQNAQHIIDVDKLRDPCPLCHLTQAEATKLVEDSSYRGEFGA